MFSDFKLPDMEAMLEHGTPTSAIFSLLGPDDGLGSPVVGSLDLHFPCEDRGFLCATLVIDDTFPFSTTPREFAAILLSQLQKIFSDIKNSQREYELFDRVDRVGDAASFWIASHMKEANLPQARAVYERLTRSTAPSIALSAEYILKEMTNDHRG